MKTKLLLLLILAALFTLAIADSEARRNLEDEYEEEEEEVVVTKKQKNKVKDKSYPPVSLLLLSPQQFRKQRSFHPSKGRFLTTLSSRTHLAEALIRVTYTL